MTLALSLILLTGCARTSVYVLDQKELERVKAGQTAEVKFDGWLLSDRAVDRILDTKIKKVNLK